jgi:RHS repeat-associated protein
VESGSVPTFGFTGELQDVSAGLVYLRARWYNGGKGRFLTRDSFEGNTAIPQSLHSYAYVHNDPTNSVDPTGMFRCKENAAIISQYAQYGFYISPLPREAAEYSTFCINSYDTADIAVNSIGMSHPLSALITLFSAQDFPGGSSPRAIRLRRIDLSSAAERLEFVLDYTTDPKLGTPFGKTFNDLDFNSQFQDPWKGESNNQVGHFLTAVGLGYATSTYVRAFSTEAGLYKASPDIGSLSDEEVALRLIVGHEMAPDVAKADQWWLPGVVQSIRTQYNITTPESLSYFRSAVEADRRGFVSARDCFLRKIIPGLPEDRESLLALRANGNNRLGNSLQDLRLSVKGWRFGQMIKNKEIVTLEQAYLWLIQNLQ